jgi:AraC-like DNA-binding protein
MGSARQHHAVNVSRGAPFMLASVVAGFQRVLQLPAAEWNALLESVELDAADLTDADAPIPLDKGLRAFEAAAVRKANPVFGIDYAKATEIGETGPLGFALVSARTVREAMQTAARFMPLVASVDISRYDEGGSSGTIVTRFPALTGINRLQYLTWGIGAIMLRLAPALPTNWKPEAVTLSAPRPLHIAEFAKFFGPGLKFDQTQNSLSVGREFLDRPMPKSDGHLFRLMTKLATIEKQRRGISESEFEGLTRTQLLTLLQDGKTLLSDLADEVGMTPAQLRGSLAQHGLSYKALLDDVRKEAATIRLLETDLSVTEIAFSLGYTDSSIFTRACHKWFGKSPRDIRSVAA